MLKAPTTLRNMVFIRLNDELFDWLRERAQTQELPMSVVARRIFKQAAQEDLKKDRQDGQQG
jgi:hypothetical protein